jgi:putative thioredoxin
VSQPRAPQPRLDVRGAIDLAALQNPAAPAPGEAGGLPVASGFVIDVTTASFPAIVQSSTSYPVVVLLWSRRSPASLTLARDLGALVDTKNGALVLARVEIDAEPQIAAAFQVETAPSVVALLGGQPIPLFQGAAPVDQLSGLIDQLLEAAAKNGVTGRAPGADLSSEEPLPTPEPELPPLHQAAYDAIDRGDLPAAVTAYEQALRENPRDDLARAGLAQVRLLARTSGIDLAAVRRAAAADPRDLEGQLAVADLDILGGQVDDAFARLIDLVRSLRGPERETVRLRIVELFEVVGAGDERVARARRALASALY